jgi:hypothetical protein
MVIIDVQNINKGDKDNEDDKWTSLEKINYNTNWNNNGEQGCYEKMRYYYKTWTIKRELKVWF